MKDSNPVFNKALVSTFRNITNTALFNRVALDNDGMEAQITKSLTDRHFTIGKDEEKLIGAITHADRENINKVRTAEARTSAATGMEEIVGLTEEELKEKYSAATPEKRSQINSSLRTQESHFQITGIEH